MANALIWIVADWQITCRSLAWQSKLVNELARLERIICQKTVRNLPKLLAPSLVPKNHIFLQTVEFVTAETRIGSKRGLPAVNFRVAPNGSAHRSQ